MYHLGERGTNCDPNHSEKDHLHRIVLNSESIMSKASWATTAYLRNDDIQGIQELDHRSDVGVKGSTRGIHVPRRDIPEELYGDKLNLSKVNKVVPHEHRLDVDLMLFENKAFDIDVYVKNQKEDEYFKITGFKFSSRAEVPSMKIKLNGAHYNNYYSIKFELISVYGENRNIGEYFKETNEVVLTKNERTIDLVQLLNRTEEPKKPVIIAEAPKEEAPTKMEFIIHDDEEKETPTRRENENNNYDRNTDQPTGEINESPSKDEAESKEQKEEERTTDRVNQDEKPSLRETEKESKKTKEENREQTKEDSETIRNNDSSKTSETKEKELKDEEVIDPYISHENKETEASPEGVQKERDISESDQSSSSSAKELKKQNGLPNLGDQIKKERTLPSGSDSTSTEKGSESDGSDEEGNPLYELLRKAVEEQQKKN